MTDVKISTNNPNTDPIIPEYDDSPKSTGQRACMNAFMLLLNSMNLLTAAAAALEGFLVKQQMDNTLAQQGQLQKDMKEITDLAPSTPDYANKLSILVKKYDSHSQLYNAQNTMLSTPVDLVQKLVQSVPQSQMGITQQFKTLIDAVSFLADLVRKG